MTGAIAPDDRITYAAASEITGRSHHYLSNLARSGALTRAGGTRQEPLTTWLSRTECEALALSSYRRGRPTAYWLTMTAAAELLGIARQNAHRSREAGKLPAQRAANGDWLVRRDDALALLMAERFPGQSGA